MSLPIGKENLISMLFPIGNLVRESCQCAFCVKMVHFYCFWKSIMLTYFMVLDRTYLAELERLKSIELMS